MQSRLEPQQSVADQNSPIASQSLEQRLQGHRLATHRSQLWASLGALLNCFVLVLPVLQPLARLRAMGQGQLLELLLRFILGV
jgi:hypothetical protein